jgi:chromosome segregation ATPase
MMDEFESNLSDTQKEELERQSAYDALKAAKEAEIAAAQDQVETKQAQLANTQEKLANAKTDIEDTRNSLGADQKYLMDLKLKCQMTDQEWSERQKTRAEETEAVSKAIEVLSNDDAHDTFTRTFNGGESFLQLAIRSHTTKTRRERAAALLMKTGKRVGAAQLVKLAGSVRLDAFERVKEAIDKMVSELTKEKQDEITHKDWCVGETNKNERQVELKERDKADTEVKIEQLTQQMNNLVKAIDVLNAEIADLQKQIQAAGEDREKENADFQLTVKDAQETQKLLGQAVQVLQAFYAKQAAGAALIAQEPAGPPPPAGFKEYSKQAGASGVIALIENIMRDAENLEKEAVHAEQDSQAAYETFVKDSNESIEAKQRDIVNKSEGKATAEGDLTQAQTDLAGIHSELEQLADYAGQLHTACDFVVKNFDLRQAARDQEIEALKQAKAILSGMK